MSKWSTDKNKCTSSKTAESVLLVASQCLLAVNVESAQTEILIHILTEVKLRMNLMI